MIAEAHAKLRREQTERDRSKLEVALEPMDPMKKRVASELLIGKHPTG